MIVPTTTELLKHTTLVEFCQQYHDAADDIRRAWEIIKAAHERLGHIIDRPRLFPRNTCEFSLPNIVEESDALLKRSAWDTIVKKTGILDVLVEAKRKVLSDSIKLGPITELPAITPEAIEAFVSGLVGSIPDLFKEAVADVARRFMPNNRRFATNADGWQMGEKVIIEYAVRWWGKYDLHRRADADLGALDTVFHLLDGKGTPKHPSNLLTTLRTAMRDDHPFAETEYFHMKWFKKGTMHITLRRPDLVARFNAAAADHYSLRRPTE